MKRDEGKLGFGICNHRKNRGDDFAVLCRRAINSFTSFFLPFFFLHSLSFLACYVMLCDAMFVRSAAVFFAESCV